MHEINLLSFGTNDPIPWMFSFMEIIFNRRMQAHWPDRESTMLRAIEYVFEMVMQCEAVIERSHFVFGCFFLSQFHSVRI